MHKIAISIGDINGVGIEIALKSHDLICQICTPIYFINDNLLKQATGILNIQIPKGFIMFESGRDFEIHPGEICKESGAFSFCSFKEAMKFTKNSLADAMVTLPINKESWAKAKIKFKGHTDALSYYFNRKAIMMLGCDKLFVALYTDHKALKNVSELIKTKDLNEFLINLYQSTKFEKFGVLSFNPHASDGGVIGKKEEEKISQAIKKANQKLNKDIFFGPLVPDTAFTPNSLKKYNKIVAMYHDQGLIPLKTLYFDKSINVSLNLPIIRTSVDHGTAFDIAYKGIASNESYIEAVKAAVKFADIKQGLIL